jgi:cytochrome oxidase Cu insertion factor (SCO1/SenC/PrrC family)
MTQLIGLATAAVLTLAVVASAQQSALPVTHLKVGDPAPNLTLRDQDNKPVNLADFRGRKNVVLAFYVLAFTGG